MNSMRTYSSRFSGLFIFILVVLLVGFLVFMTIRSSNQDTGFVDEGATTSDNSFVLDGEETPPSDTESDDLIIVGSVGGASDSQVTPEVVQSNSEGLPNTGPSGTLSTVVLLSLFSAAVASYLRSKSELVASARTK